MEPFVLSSKKPSISTSSVQYTAGEYPNLPAKGRIEFLQLPDFKMRVGYWKHTSKKKRATVILVNGRREFMEKHGEFIGDFLARGYDVYAYDHRGQGLSDRPLENRKKSHIEDFDHFVKDLAYYIEQKITPERKRDNDETPLYMVSHSMGGNIAFRFLHDYPNLIEKAVFLAPFLGLKYPNILLRILIRNLVKFFSFFGFSNSFAFGQTAEKTPLQRKISRKDLTHDKARYAREGRILNAMPKLYVGGVTFKWVRAAMESLDLVSKADYSNDMKTKSLFILAEEEAVVDNNRVHKVIDLLPDAQRVMIKGARHEMYREIDPIRDKMWHEISQFFK